jgi:hypothetical protein
MEATQMETKITCGVNPNGTMTRYDAIVWGPTGIIGRGRGASRAEAISEAKSDVWRRGHVAATAIARWLGYPVSK